MQKLLRSNLFSNNSLRFSIQLCNYSIKENARIIDICPYKEFVHIEYGKKTKKFGIRWIRDNCRCKDCLDSRTFQRLYNTSNLGEEIDIRSCKIDKNNNINMEWMNGHITKLNLDWAFEMEQLKPHTCQYDNLLNSYETWNKAFFHNRELPHVDYNNVISSSNGVIKWIENIEKFGFGIVNNCPILPEDDTSTSREIMEKLGNISKTFFEEKGIWDINVTQKENLEHADTAYTNLYLPPHVDGTYFSDPPGIQFFQIPKHNGDGGETILVDGFRVGELLKVYYHELFDYLCLFPMTFHYYEKGISLRNSSCVFTLHDDRFLRFSFNNNDRMPHHIPVTDQRYYYDSISYLMKMLNDEKNQLKFKLAPDQLLVTNNWRVLHGRTAFTGSRRLVGAYIGMNEFLGKARTLRNTIPEAK